MLGLSAVLRSSSEIDDNSKTKLFRLFHIMYLYSIRSKKKIKNKHKPKWFYRLNNKNFLFIAIHLFAYTTRIFKTIISVEEKKRNSILPEIKSFRYTSICYYYYYYCFSILSYRNIQFHSGIQRTINPTVLPSNNLIKLNTF